MGHRCSLNVWEALASQRARQWAAHRSVAPQRLVGAPPPGPEQGNEVLNERAKSLGSLVALSWRLPGWLTSRGSASRSRFHGALPARLWCWIKRFGSLPARRALAGATCSLLLARACAPGRLRVRSGAQGELEKAAFRCARCWSHFTLQGRCAAARRRRRRPCQAPRCSHLQRASQPPASSVVMDGCVGEGPLIWARGSGWSELGRLPLSGGGGRAPPRPCTWTPAAALLMSRAWVKSRSHVCAGLLTGIT